jgi:hypothetical protein
MLLLCPEAKEGKHYVGSKVVSYHLRDVFSVYIDSHHCTLFDRRNEAVVPDAIPNLSITDLLDKLVGILK